MEYQVVWSGDDVEGMAEDINAMIAEGWEVYGNLCLSNASNEDSEDGKDADTIIVAQAMTRSDHNKNLYCLIKIFSKMLSIPNPESQTINDFINNSLTEDCKNFLEERNRKRK